MDVAGTSAAFIMTAPIANDLGLNVVNSNWVVYSYSIPFASLLLFAGRIADLYVSKGYPVMAHNAGFLLDPMPVEADSKSPSLVFSVGFLGNGVLSLAISFMNNKYAFFVLRALSAVFAVFTMPSSVNMIGEHPPVSV